MNYIQPDYRIPSGKMIRVIVSTDAKNEADDQYAIVHTLLSPKFDVRGVIASHFGEEKSSHSMMDSYNEICKVFDLMGIKKNVVYKGAEHAISGSLPLNTDGVQLIINEAMREDSDLPLYVTVLGPLTDVASAILLKPEIIDRITVIWIGGGNYPLGGMEYNLKNDIQAAVAVFESGVNLWQVPEKVYQQMLVSVAELCIRVKPQGEIGNYLFSQLEEWGQTFFGKRSYLRTGECWYLGDSPTVGILLNEHPNDYELISAPKILPDMRYELTEGRHQIRVYHHVDSRFILEDFYAKIQLFADHPGTFVY